MMFAILVSHTKQMESWGKVPKERKKALLCFIFMYVIYMQNCIQANIQTVEL